MSKEYRLIALGDGQCLKVADKNRYPYIEEYFERKRRCAYKKALPFYKKFNIPLSDA